MPSAPSPAAAPSPASAAPPAPASVYSRGSRRAWSRTDTARWLDDRNAPLLALLRRHPGVIHDYSLPSIRFAGTMLRTHDRALFDVIHAAVARAPSDEARATLSLHDLLP